MCAVMMPSTGCKAASGAANEVPRSVRVMANIAETAEYL
jgi:hypothetical protein